MKSKHVLSISAATFLCLVSPFAMSVRALAATAPTIITQPASETVAAGTEATFSVVASGTAPLSYQWYKKGSAIKGATASKYITPATTDADNGSSFTVTITNAAGHVTSNAAILTVHDRPTITTQPTSTAVPVGTAATFSVVASGTAPLTYQWYKEGGNPQLVYPISGATSSKYTTPPTTEADNGFIYWVVIRNSVGSAQSSSVLLTVGVPPTVTGPPSMTVSVGASATLTATAGNTGASPFSYQWFKNGTIIEGATDAGYVSPPVTKADNGSSFTVVVTNAYGHATSKPAIITVLGATTSLPIVGTWSGTATITGPSNSTGTYRMNASFVQNPYSLIATIVYTDESGITQSAAGIATLNGSNLFTVALTDFGTVANIAAGLSPDLLTITGTAEGSDGYDTAGGSGKLVLSPDQKTLTGSGTDSSGAAYTWVLIRD